MAKQTTEKKEFAWDTEKLIGEFGDNKKKTEVRICTLSGKTYVSAQSYVMSAKTNDWKRTKNNTMEMSLFKELQHFVGKWEMQEAFAGKEETIEEKKPKKEKAPLKAKKDEPKEEKSKRTRKTAAK